MPIKLGKQTFTVPSPGGMKSFALQQRILPVVSRIIEVFAVVAHSKGITDPEGMKALLEADVLEMLPQVLPLLGRVFAQMPAGELEAITRELLREAKFDGKPLFMDNGQDAFDAVMAGRNIDTWRLLWHAVHVWYPDFFALAGSFNASAEPAKSSEEPTTSAKPGRASASSPKAG